MWDSNGDNLPTGIKFAHTMSGSENEDIDIGLKYVSTGESTGLSTSTSQGFA